MGSSSEEIDQAGSEKQVTSDDNTGIGRSYECTFCKRGFTNAQALGGHMNIHRKDKAKAKQKNNQPNKALEDSTSKYYASNNSFHHHQQQQQQQRPYSTAMAAYMSYQLYFPSSPSNPSAGPTNYLNGYGNDHHHQVDQTESLGMSTADHEEEVKNIGEVDLELRLGYQYP